jgi:hypothetical protein
MSGDYPALFSSSLLMAAPTEEGDHDWVKSITEIEKMLEIIEQVEQFRITYVDN